MDNAYDANEVLTFDDELVHQCDEIRAIAKKDWFKPASVSLAKLDQVKAKVYNVGLADARSFRNVNRKPPAAPPVVSTATAVTLSDLYAKPPLSKLSYQKTAWGFGSETYVPEIIRRAGGVSTRPTRPSSAKVSTGTKPVQVQKSRPQSAKDPLCPPGQKKTSILGVKGQRYDPTVKYAVVTSPQSIPGSVIGWAGPPAGFVAPHRHDGQLVDMRGLYQVNGDSSLPPAPNTSPEPFEGDPRVTNIHESPPPSPGLHLSFTLPSAEADATDEPDTSRLLEEADEYVRNQKEKEALKIKLFQADKHGSIPAKKEPKTEAESSLSEAESSLSEANQFSDEVGMLFQNVASSFSSSTLQMSDDDECQSLASVTPSSGSKQKSSQESTSFESVSVTDSGLSAEDKSTVDGFSANETCPSKEESPPTYGLEYLGPPRHERQARTHPIFLMPEDKSVSKQLKPHPPADNIGRHNGTKPPHHHRVGVHIREDRNITVDITPRNLGRKIPEKNSFKNSFTNHSREDVTGRGESRLSHLAQTPSQDVDLEVTAVKVHRRGKTPETHPVTLPPTITVCYDDDSDGSSTGSGKKKWKKKWKNVKRAKKKDPVTLVGKLAMSDDEDDGDDPAKDVSLLLEGDMGEDGGPKDQGVGRSPSVVSKSAGERNYYDIARHHRPGTDASDSEEKENFVTVTTKTFEFDAAKPQESVVKKILEAPSLKQRERQTPSSLESNLSGPRSALTQKSRSSKLVVSEMQRVVPPGSKSGIIQNGIMDHMGAGDTGLQEPENDERPLSRMGFVPMETAPNAEDIKEGIVSEAPKEEPAHRPPSGKRRPLSAANKANQPAGAKSRQSRSRSKGNVAAKRRSSSACPAISHTPSTVDIQRANTAAQAMRSEDTSTAKRSSSASRVVETRKTYASYSNSQQSSRQHRAGAKSAPAGGRGKAVYLKSKNPLLEEYDTEELEECREIQERLAQYSIDVKTETLERALFPPSGRTLYYDLSSDIPRSYSSGLLSHPRYWCPKEYKQLKLAEKRLAMAELSLWRQKKVEERKAKLAAAKEAGENGKNKKKKTGKKIGRRKSVC